MKPLTVFEYDRIVNAESGVAAPAVPNRVFSWLEAQCLRNDDGAPRWLKLTQRHGQKTIHVSSFVGVLRAPCGFQIEVLPKTGRHTSVDEARKLLIRMLKCLAGFRHIKTASADLATERMSLLEMFIKEFLEAVRSLVQRGLRSDYVQRRDNLSVLRGRLLVAQQVAVNCVRRDRFFTEYDEFSQDRAENRLVRSALRQVLTLSRTQGNQRLARELAFVFADVPLSADVAQDIQRIRLDRGMKYYEPAMGWAKLILKGVSPISSVGTEESPSLLFPMEALFEAYVAKHLSNQLRATLFLKAQARSQHLVNHKGQPWCRLKPDLLVKDKERARVVLDTKWKLLDIADGSARDKYQLDQADLYQLYAYGHHYLDDTADGVRDIVLVYPKTNAFAEPLPIFDFPKTPGMRLWVLPFDLEERRLRLPESKDLDLVFSDPA